MNKNSHIHYYETMPQLIILIASSGLSPATVFTASNVSKYSIFFLTILNIKILPQKQRVYHLNEELKQSLRRINFHLY